MCAQFNKLDLKGQNYYAGLDYYPAGRGTGIFTRYSAG